MATLTSTGAVNLTSSTNWSPAQIPVTGDDLIVAAHTLTLDSDMTLNTITFNSSTSRVAISGTSRSVQATNGFSVTGSPAILISTTLPSGTSVTLTGQWSGAGSVTLAASTGGNLTLQTVGGVNSSILFADVNAFKQICSSWTAGTLMTIGRLNYASMGTVSATFVGMSGGSWIHNSSGTNTFGAGNNRICNLSGAATIQWTGSVDSLCNGGNSHLFTLASSSSSHQIGQSGDTFILRNSNGTAVTALLSLTAGVCEIIGSCRSRLDSVTFLLNGGTLRWRNQSVSIPSSDYCLIQNTGSLLDISGLAVTVSGKFCYVETSAGTTAATAGTSITCTSVDANAVAVGTTSLDGRIVTLASDPPTLPAVQNVASGTVYGYVAAPLTGTGIINDPATIAAAMVTSFASLPTVMTRTTIATLASQTSFTLTAGSPDNNAYVGMSLIAVSAGNSQRKEVGTISAYTGATRTVTLASDPGVYTLAIGDTVWVVAGASSSGGGAVDLSEVLSKLPVSGRAATEAQVAAAVSDALGDADIPINVVNAFGDGSALSALVPDNGTIAILAARLTAARAGYLDKLNVTGVVASQADINALNQSASRRVILQTVGQWEMPESGSTSYTIELRTFDGDGASANADSNPTIIVTGQTTGSLAANLGSITNPATGVYRWEYSAASNAAIEPVRIDTSATMGGSAFPMSVYTQVTDFVGVDFTATDRNNITAIFNKLPSRGFLSGTTVASGAVLPADLGLAAANLDSHLTTISTNAAAAKAAAESADGKLTTGRLSRIDALPTTAAGTTGGLALHGASGGGSGEQDWTDTERAQIRYRLGLNGTTTAPTEPTPDPIVITPSSGDLTTGFLVCVDSAAAVQADVSVYCRLADVPVGGDGFAYSRGLQTAISNELGVVEFSLVKGASYYVWRGSNRMPEIDPVLIPADVGSTYELPSLVG